MPTDAEITFADHMGRFYARRYSFPPMVGRLVGYLAVCDPPQQTIGELAEALLASRSAITGAVKSLETIHVLSRSRSAGERMDRVRVDMGSPESRGMDISEYEELGHMAHEGLDVLRRSHGTAGNPVGDGGLRRIPRWSRFPYSIRSGKTRRAALVASGKLPEQPSQGEPHDDRPPTGDRGHRVCKSFGATPVLGGVDLTVARGNYFRPPGA